MNSNVTKNMNEDEILVFEKLADIMIRAEVDKGNITELNETEF